MPKYKYEKCDNAERSAKISKAKSIPVRCIETGVVYESAKIASKCVGLNSRSSIGQCCKGKLKTADGYHWMFA